MKISSEMLWVSGILIAVVGGMYFFCTSEIGSIMIMQNDSNPFMSHEQIVRKNQETIIKQNAELIRLQKLAVENNK